MGINRYGKEAILLSTKKHPNHKQDSIVDLGKLNGGLNIQELDYRLKPNESPELKNLWWENGVLCSRQGQKVTATFHETPVAMSEMLFNGYRIFHAGTHLYAQYLGSDPETYGKIISEVSYWQLGFDWIPMINDDASPFSDLDVGTKSGVFFRYNDDNLYYKNEGHFVRIIPAILGEGYDYYNFSAENVIDDAFVPLIQLNTDPTTGGSSTGTNQPENRLSKSRRVQYRSNGKKDYMLLGAKEETDEIVIEKVTVNGDNVPAYEEPEEGTQAETLTYTYAFNTDKGAWLLTFSTAPATPATGVDNNVEIQYSIDNESTRNAMNAILDCSLVETFGGGGEMCVFLAGSSKQPNAYFWNGNNTAMDISYWPMEQYNLAGTPDDAVTGFGKQSIYLFVFQKRRLCKVLLSTTTINDRAYITADYTPVNAKIGCDVPGSIQLIDNNLVFANTKGGIYRVSDTTLSNENNVVCISDKVNGTDESGGLLYDLRIGGAVCSLDDGERYWLTIGGNVWLWHYEESSYKDPVWYYFTDIPARQLVYTDKHETIHIGHENDLTVFEDLMLDYDEQGIDKVYRSPIFNFGSYLRYKDVTNLLLSCRGDTFHNTTLSYLTDYEEREDETPAENEVWTLGFRDLSRMSLSAQPAASVFRRTPNCKRVRHFGFKLKNNMPGDDLSVASAQIFYRGYGEER